MVSTRLLLSCSRPLLTKSANNIGPSSCAALSSTNNVLVSKKYSIRDFHKSASTRNQSSTTTSPEPKADQTQQVPQFADAFAKVPVIKKTHGIKVATLRFETFMQNNDDLNFHLEFVRRVAAAFGIPCSMPKDVEKEVTVRTVIRTHFAKKGSQENYWRRIKKVHVDLYDANESVVEKMIDYLDQNPPIDIRLHITRYRFRQPGWGNQIRKSMDNVPMLQKQSDKTILEEADQITKELEALVAQEEESLPQQEQQQDDKTAPEEKPKKTSSTKSKETTTETTKEASSESKPESKDTTTTTTEKVKEEKVVSKTEVKSKEPSTTSSKEEQKPSKAE